MAAEIESLCGRLSLSGGEQEGIQILDEELSEGRAQMARSLVGRIGSTKRINREAFRTLMMRLWKPMGSVEFKEIQEHLWLFEFSHERDKDKVLLGRPWLFDRHLVIIHEFDGSISPAQLVFSHSPFWVQIHDLPLICLTRGVGRKIGESLGKVLEVEVPGEDAGWGRSLRLKVLLDITKPLDRGRALILEGKSVWISFKYEKLPLCCFNCGRIIHGSQGCPNPRLNSLVKPENSQWGTWLRADVPRKVLGDSSRGRFSGQTSKEQTRPSPPLSDTGDRRSELNVPPMASPTPFLFQARQSRDSPSVTKTVPVPTGRVTKVTHNSNNGPSVTHGINLTDPGNFSGTTSGTFLFESPALGGKASARQLNTSLVTDNGPDSGPTSIQNGTGPSPISGLTKSGPPHVHTTHVSQPASKTPESPPVSEVALHNVSSDPPAGNSLSESISVGNLSFAPGAFSGIASTKQKSWKRRAREVHGGKLKPPSVVSTSNKRSLIPCELDTQAEHKEKKGKGERNGSLSPTLAAAVAQPGQLQ